MVIVTITPTNLVESTTGIFKLLMSFSTASAGGGVRRKISRLVSSDFLKDAKEMYMNICVKLLITNRII